MKQELIDKFQELIQQEQINKVKDEANALIQAFEKEKHEAIKTEKKAFVAEGGDPHYFEPSKDPLDSKFKEIENIFSDKLEQYKSELKKELDQNLEIKLALITEIKDVNENEENIGKAFNRINAIKKKWDETGAVPNHKKHEVREDYSKLVEEFYYHIKIFKELKDHDFKKNSELKTDVIERMQKLLDLKSIKEIQLLLDAYLVEWDRLGPTFQKDWPEIKEKFHLVYNEINHKISEHYKNLRDKQKENADLKQAIIDELKTISENVPKDHNNWVNQTNALNEIQEKYRKIGPTQKKKNDSLWEEFRGLIDQFYEAKREFYKEKKQEFKEVRSDKAQIIEAAKKIIPEDEVNPEMIDWRKITDEIISLQKDWKQSGILKQSEERKMWVEFRGVCDIFFQKKKAFYASQIERQKENQKQKEDIIKLLEDFKPSGIAEDDHEKLRQLTYDFQQIGMVPIKSKNQISNSFTKATANVAKQLNIGAKELKSTLFKNKVDVIQNEDPAAKQKLLNEQKFIKRKIKELEDEKFQYENNLGFFKYTPDDNPLKKEVLDKIEAVGNQIKDWKEKSKTINLALREANKTAAPKTEEPKAEEPANNPETPETT